MRRLLAACLALVLSTGLARAELASLVADRIFIDDNAVLTAEGNVEVFFDAARLTASRIRYDQRSERLEIDGPLALIEEGGDSVILAGSAELDADLERAIFTSARIVLDQQLQIAAQEIARASGSLTRISRVVASSCEVCEAGRPPIWEIRARRIVRDEDRLVLVFDDAQLRLGGVPVFYIPRLRLPDPSVTRKTGFLTPEIEVRSRLSTGIKAPYFIVIDPQTDLTLTPYLSSATTTLQAGFRRLYRRGELSFEGAVSRDELRPDSTRAFLFAEGSFDLPRDFTLSFDLELLSDDSYLLDYGFDRKDRLDSNLTLERVRRESAFRGAVTSFRTLRASEAPISEELPNALGELSYTTRLAADPRWGSVWASFDATTLGRQSGDPGVGRDVSRLSAELRWDGSWLLPRGIVAEATSSLSIAQYFVDEDPAFDSTVDRVTPAAAVTLRWPLARQGANGVRTLLEPAIQLAWVDPGDAEVPNEDSTVVEFDEGNLFALSRFPGLDAVEDGLRADLGVSYTRLDPAGWSLGATVGRVLRFDTPEATLVDTTGLSGDSSDWLLALRYDTATGLDIDSRTLFADDFDITRSETRLGWQTDLFDLESTYLWLPAEPAENRIEDISELQLAGSYQITPFWRAGAEWRYEADTGQTTEAGLNFRYENECIGVDLSASRRFTSSTTVEPVTEYGLSVFLSGFGGSDGRRIRNRCGG